MMRVFTHLRDLARDTRGNGLVELALLSPIIATLFMGMMDASMGISRKLTIEQAAQRSVERAISYGSAGANFNDIAADAAASAGVPVDQVTVDVWLECNGTRQSSFTNVCGNADQVARFISVEITDNYEPMFPYGPLAKSIGADANGEFPLNVESSVRIQ